MPLRDGFFSTATQTSCCNRIQRSNRVRLLVVSTHDFPDTRTDRGELDTFQSRVDWTCPRTREEESAASTGMLENPEILHI